MQHLLVMDDEVGSRVSLQAILGGEYRVTTVDATGAGLEVLTRETVDLILLGVHDTQRDGIPRLRSIRAVRPHVPVVMIGVSNAVREAVGRLNGDVCDCVVKPFTVPEIKRIVSRSLLQTTLRRRVAALEPVLDPVDALASMIAAQRGLHDVIERARHLLAHEGYVALRGARGLDLRGLARYLHATEETAPDPFMVVEAAVLDACDAEATLLGQEGAMLDQHGATTQAGRWEQSGAGTLYLEDVDLLPHDVQAAVAEGLRKRAVVRAGGRVAVPVDARVVLTLPDADEAGLDPQLQDALRDRCVVVPGLAARPGDLPPLCEHMLAGLRRGLRVCGRRFDDDAREALARYGWPGNTRELRGLLERLLVQHPARETFTLADLPPEYLSPDAVRAVRGDMPALEDAVSRYEKALIERALEVTDGVQTRAADQLGTTRRILRYRMQKLGIVAAPPNGGGRRGPAGH